MTTTCTDRKAMRKSLLFHEQALFEMTTDPFPPSSPDTDPRLLEALASLNQISDAINRIGSADADQNDLSLQLIVESAIRVVPGSSAVIYTYDQKTGLFENESRVSSEPEGHAPSTTNHPDDAPRPHGSGMRTIQRRRRIFSYEEPDLNVHPYHAARGVKAVACFPLIVAEQVVGLLYIYLHEERQFTYLEQLMLDNFVNQAAMAIYHARRLAGMRRDLIRKEEELNQLRRAGLLISSRLRLDETLDSILQLALEITNAQYGIFRLLDKNGEYLVTRVVTGIRLERPLVEKLPLDGNSVMAYVARTREPLLISDLRQEPWSKIYYPLDSNLEMRSELAVPLINSSGRLEGVLNLESPQLGAFSEDDNHMLQSLATYAITAIQEVRLLDALQEAARLLISQPTQKVLDRLCAMANNLLNTSSSAIWLKNESGDFQLTSSDGHGQYTDKVFKETDQSNVLLIPLPGSDQAKELGMFGVFNADPDEERSAKSEWDKKVLACLANYAALAVKNESHQQALRTSQEKHWTAETFAAVGDISANLLHNMNNKVGTIPVRIQAIQDKYQPILETDSYLANNLKEIERSASDAMQIVQENLSHLRPILMENVYIAARVSDAIRVVQIPNGIQVKTNGLEDLPPVIAGGQSLIFVFRNLIENAISAMNGNGSIFIQGVALPEWVEVSVTDSGPGIAPEFHNQIFELNFSRTSAHPGKLGFGLWWVKTLMTRLGGSVTVESDGNHGTTFRLRLPTMERS
ncbi:MAG: GAF domain-containing protein [Anaerolineae bacterium]|nr:GAF domain-containing protein [Anaerolineae bacterium]MCI0611065.1 GAF domain-containing protein [Anaerolineae bacterium]